MEYKVSGSALRDNVDEEDKRYLEAVLQGIAPGAIPSGFNQNGLRTVYINESGLYSLIFGSKLPVAQKFKRWVTSEVLPAIRKRGTYQLRVQLEEQQQALAAKDAEIARKDLNTRNFIHNVKVRDKNEYIYIMTTKLYAQNNQFKVGRTKNLVARLASANSTRAEGDKLFYVWIFKCHEAVKHHSSAFKMQTFCQADNLIFSISLQPLDNLFFHLSNYETSQKSSPAGLIS